MLTRRGKISEQRPLEGGACRAVSEKVADERGASIIIALFFLLICVMVAAVVVNFSGANAERSTQHTTEQQAYLTTTSALQLVEDAYQGDSGLSFSAQSADDYTFSYGGMGSTSAIGQWTQQETLKVFESKKNGTAYKPTAQEFTIHADSGLISTADVRVSLTMDNDYTITAKMAKAVDNYSYAMQVAIPLSANHSSVSLGGNGTPVYPYTVTWYAG